MKKKTEVNKDFEKAFEVLLKQIAEAKENINRNKDKAAIEWLMSRGFFSLNEEDAEEVEK